MTIDNKQRVSSLNLKPGSNSTLRRGSTFHGVSVNNIDTVNNTQSTTPITRTITNHGSGSSVLSAQKEASTFYKLFNPDITDQHGIDLLTTAYKDTVVLTQQHLKLLSRLCTIVHCNHGDTVFKRHETAMCLSIVLQGSVGALIDTIDTKHTAYHTTDILGANEWLQHISYNTGKTSHNANNSIDIKTTHRQFDEIVLSNDTYIALLTYNDLLHIEKLVPELYSKLLVLCLQAQAQHLQHNHGLHVAQREVPQRHSTSKKTFLTEPIDDTTLQGKQTLHTPNHHRRQSSLSTTREMAIQHEQHLAELHPQYKYELIYRQHFADEIQCIEQCIGTNDHVIIDLNAQSQYRIQIKHKAIVINDTSKHHSHSNSDVELNGSPNASRGASRMPLQVNNIKDKDHNKQIEKLQRELAFLKQKCSRHDEIVADRDAAIDSLQHELKQASEIQVKYNKCRSELQTMQHKQVQLELLIHTNKSKQQQENVTQQVELQKQHQTELQQKQSALDQLHTIHNTIQQQLADLQQKHDLYVQQSQQVYNQNTAMQSLQQQLQTLQQEYNTLQNTYNNNTTAYDSIVQQLRIKLGESERKLNTVIQWKQQAMIYADEWAHERNKLKKKLLRAHEQLTTAQQHCINYRILLQRLAIKQYVMQFKAKRMLYNYYERLVTITTDSLTESLNDRALEHSVQVDSTNDIQLRISQRMHSIPWCKQRNTTPIIEFIQSIDKELDTLQQTQYTVHEQKQKWRFTANIFFQRNIELTNTYIQHDKLLEETNNNIYNITKHSKLLADKYNELQQKLKFVQCERDEYNKLYQNEVKKQLHLDSDTQKQEQNQFNRTVVLQRKCRELEQQYDVLNNKKSKLQQTIDTLNEQKSQLNTEYTTLQQQYTTLQQNIDTVLRSSTGQTYTQLQTNAQVINELNKALPLQAAAHVTQNSVLSTRKIDKHKSKRANTAHAGSKSQKSLLPTIYNTTHSVKLDHSVQQRRQELDDALKNLSLSTTELNVTA